LWGLKDLGYGGRMPRHSGKYSRDKNKKLSLSVDNIHFPDEPKPVADVDGFETPTGISRRDFLKYVITAGGVALGLYGYSKLLERKPQHPYTPPTEQPVKQPTQEPTPETLDEKIRRLLREYCKEINPYPELEEALIPQIKDIVYKGDKWHYNKRLVDLDTEDNIFEKFISKAVGHEIELYETGQTDFDLVKELNDLERAQVLLPKEIISYSIKNPEDKEGSTPELRLKIAYENVNPDLEFNGKSPQEWLHDVAKEVYEIGSKSMKGMSLEEIREVLRHEDTWTKLSPEEITYGVSLFAAFGHHPIDNWNFSAKIFEKVFEEMMKKDLLAVYIIGFPDGIRRDFIKEIPMAEQDVPYYSVLVGREFGRPTFVAGACYPSSKKYRVYHDEAYVKTKTDKFFSEWDSYPYFGFWLSREAFIKDYENSPIQPSFVDVKWEPFKI
jgi:hypothetical protein